MQDDKEKRWLIAQEHEKKYWVKASNKIENTDRDLSYYKDRCEQIKNSFHGLGVNWAEVRILEIGSGPLGVVNYMDGDCYALDPLMDSYNNQKKLIANRRRSVTYLQGKGEMLPFEGSFFKIVFMINVLDHCMDPKKTVDETYRVLASNGYLYLVVNVRSKYGFFMRNIMEYFRLDKGHPHSYTKNIVDSEVRRNFETISSHLEDFKEKKRRISRNTVWREYLKYILGVNGYRYTLLLEKMG